MNRSFLEVEPRDFKPMAVPGLEKEVRDAVNAALKALSTWRNEIADTNRHNGKRVIEKMAAAAAALGWPEQIVEATRAQMQSITNMQIQTMDHMMDAWEEQIKSPNMPSAMISRLKSLPSFGAAGSWPSAGALQAGAMNPFQFYAQFAEQWQKACAEAMSFWGKAGKLYDNAGRHSS